MTPKGEVIYLFLLVVGFIQIAESQNITKNLTASSSFKITFNVYSDAGFINLLTESDVVDTDQDVYLKAELNHITELDLIGTLCYTTPTEDPMDSNNFTIITDGCSVSHYVTNIFQNTSSDVPNFSFTSRVFRFVEEEEGEESNSLYFHCLLTVCLPGSDECSLSSCSTKRRKRSINVRDSSKVSTGLTIGK